jgi:uncharacterized protein YjbI with pentapeptide repeats
MTVPFPVLTWARKTLVEGKVNPASRRPISPFSNRLVLPGLEVIDHAKFDSDAKFDAVRETVSLRYRHLEGAVLTDAGLRKADFTAALLQNALLDHADLRGAKFESADWRKQPGRPRESIRTNLDSASLDGARLQGALLDGASLKGASLNTASLQGASLDHASLQGAVLDGASLQGAVMTSGHLQGASLDGAHLVGASLASVELQAASLLSAELAGAMMVNAHLEGATLDYAHLEGTNLDRAHLQASSLDYVHLEGATLASAELQGASITGACVWRASDLGFGGGSRGPFDATNARIQYVKTQAEDCNWTPTSYNDLVLHVSEQVPAGVYRDNALERVKSTLNRDMPMTVQSEFEKRWLNLETQSPTQSEFESEIESQIRASGCNGTPDVVVAFVEKLKSAFLTTHSGGMLLPPPVNTWFPLRSSRWASLAAEFLNKDCKGADGIAAGTVAVLKEISASSVRPAEQYPP